jgi:hypothetical protein
VTSGAVELLKAIKYAINEHETGRNFILRGLSIDMDHLVCDGKVPPRLHHGIKSASTLCFIGKVSARPERLSLEELEELFSLPEGHKSVINYSNEETRADEKEKIAASDAEQG